MRINGLNPFGKLCITLGMIPSSYKESMTYEEQLLWMFNYLDKTLIPKINEQSDTINDLIGLYNQLKEYVDNYFENLDVQDEINNKLDEMVEDGTFDVIFAQVDEKIGDLSTLATTDKTSIVNAVNEINSNENTTDAKIGNLSNLTTTAKNNIVSAINEVNSNESNTDSKIGILSNLTTTAKTNVVSAINEVNGKNALTFVPFQVTVPANTQLVTTTANYPTGYTKENSVILGVYSGTTSLSYQTDEIYKVQMFTSNMEIYYKGSTTWDTQQVRDYSILLMKKQ